MKDEFEKALQWLSSVYRERALSRKCDKYDDDYIVKFLKGKLPLYQHLQFISHLEVCDYCLQRVIDFCWDEEMKLSAEEKERIKNLAKLPVIAFLITRRGAYFLNIVNLWNISAKVRMKARRRALRGGPHKHRTATLRESIYEVTSKKVDATLKFVNLDGKIKLIVEKVKDKEKEEEIKDFVFEVYEDANLIAVGEKEVTFPIEKKSFLCIIRKEKEILLKIKLDLTTL